VSAIHQHLVHLGLRTKTGLVAETGAARETHHFALLAAYGVGSVHPYLALESLAEFAKDKDELYQFEKNYVKAVGKGLLKVMSKMG
ncbi:glutamate synthase central domain-containing protein, partial [Vibrio parahaemolyticus]